jgi:hypothetical protein
MSIRPSNSSCTEEHPATTVDESQRSLKSILLVRVACHSQVKADESRMGRPTFIEDFLLEHSPLGQPADS